MLLQVTPMRHCESLTLRHGEGIMTEAICKFFVRVFI